MEIIESGNLQMDGEVIDYRLSIRCRESIDAFEEVISGC